MMKKIHLLLLMSLVLLGSCRELEGVQPSGIDQLSITTKVSSSDGVWCDLSDPSGTFTVRSVATKIEVDNSVFEQGDKIGLYVVEWAGATEVTQVKTALEAVGNQTDNHLFTYSTSPSNGWSALPLSNPLTWRKVSLFAYHPFLASVADALQVPFTVREDQSAGVLTTDYLMWGKGAANDAGYTPAIDATPIVLDFEHKLAHVDMNVTLPALFNGLSFVSIDAASVLGVPVSGNKFNISDGVLTLSADAADIKPVKMSKKSGTNPLMGEFSAVITPTTIAAGKEIIKIDYTAAGGVKGSLYFYAGASGFKFETNKRYTITLSTDEFGFAADLPEFANSLETTESFIIRSSGSETWTLTSGDPSWIQVTDNATTLAWGDSFTGTGDKVCKIKVLSNTTGRSRMSKLTLSAAGRTSVELVVFQNAIPHVPTPPTANQIIEAGGLRWTTGNLVAKDARNAKVGKPEDGGLYFQFGSLIGWKGGATGDGTGRAAKADKTFYVGSTFNAADEVQVVPVPFTRIADIGATWPDQAGNNLYYFGLNTAPYETAGANIQDYSGVLDGTLASDGVGDPCRYYLGDTWRLPTYLETKAMTDAAAKTWSGTWNISSTDTYMVCEFTGGAELKFPAVGLRLYSNGTIRNVGDNGWYWSSSVFNSTEGYSLEFSSGSVVDPQSSNYGRRYGMPVRCVQDLPYEPQPPTADQVVEAGGLRWTTGNLVAHGARNAKVGKPEDGGLYFQFGSLIGWKGGATGDGTGRAATANGSYYVGSSFNAASEVQVYPSVFNKIGNIGITWPSQAINLYYFGLSSYATDGANIQDYSGVLDGTLASDGVGDPCRYYLGDTWRMPTYLETKIMNDAAAKKEWPGTWDRDIPSTDSYFVCTFSGGELKFPAVGRRISTDGTIYNVGYIGFYWSSSVYSSSDGYVLYFYERSARPHTLSDRRDGCPVRCVSGN